MIDQSSISSFPVFNSFHLCSNPLAEKIYKLGTLLTRPFLYQANLATKVFGTNIRPGKSFTELTFTQKTWKILKICSLFTIIIPLLLGLLAAFGLLLRVCASTSRPKISLLHNSKIEFKKLLSDETIHLATYNTALMPKFISNVNNMRSSKARAEEIGQMYKNRETTPDVLCLQECFDIDATAILCEHLKTIYPHIVYCVSPNELGLNSGLLIASKFHIENMHFSDYQAAKGEDALAHKGYLGVCVKLDELRTCWVYNTHLQAKKGVVYETVRDTQLEQLKSHIESLQVETPIFVVGDFNKSKIDDEKEENVEYCSNFLGEKFINLQKTQASATWYDKSNIIAD